MLLVWALVVMAMATIASTGDATTNWAGALYLSLLKLSPLESLDQQHKLCLELAGQKNAHAWN